MSTNTISLLHRLRKRFRVKHDCKTFLTDSTEFFIYFEHLVYSSRVAYQEHTKCVTEQEKYGGANYNAPSNMNKGEKKQNQWFEIVQSAINLNTGTTPAKALLKKLQNYPNTPRKRAKFIVKRNSDNRNTRKKLENNVFLDFRTLLVTQ